MKCLDKDCKRKAITRGLCASDYNRVSARIRNGEITDAAAVNDGLILASKKRATDPALKKAYSVGKPQSEYVPTVEDIADAVSRIKVFSELLGTEIARLKGENAALRERFGTILKSLRD